MNLKFAAPVILLVALVVAASGCTDEGSETTGGPSESTTGSAIQIQVDYEGSWSGNYGDENGDQSVEGTGSQTFDIQGNPTVVSAVFQKMDDGSGTMTVRILKDGEVVQERSTSAQYGVVSVSASF